MNTDKQDPEIVARHVDSQGSPRSEQTLADADQTAANADQQISGADQRASDTDQALAGLDQAASDHEQEKADRLHEAVVDPTPAEVKGLPGDQGGQGDRLRSPPEGPHRALPNRPRPRRRGRPARSDGG